MPDTAPSGTPADDARRRPDAGSASGAPAETPATATATSSLLGIAVAAAAAAAGDSDKAASDAERRMALLRKEILRINRDNTLTNQEKNREIQKLLSAAHGVRGGNGSADGDRCDGNNNDDDNDDDGSVRESRGGPSGGSREDGQRHGGEHEARQSQQQRNRPGTAAEKDLCRVYHDHAETVFGCRHYMRSVKIQAACCGKWVVCRFCHDENSDHSFIRQSTRHMMCMHCLTVQGCAQVCGNSACGKSVALYYCDTCKMWDDDANKKIYHCEACGICRIGHGLGVDYFHCDKCNMCMAIGLRNNHRCIERNLESDCPICGEYMFTSTTTVIFMPCGHCIHHRCYHEHMQTSFTCPTCSKSLVAMTEYYRRIDELLKTHSMPREFTNQASVILCNDCERKSIAPYHFVYHKCLNIAFKPDATDVTMPFPQRKQTIYAGPEDDPLLPSAGDSSGALPPRAMQHATYGSSNSNSSIALLGAQEIALLHAAAQVPETQQTIEAQTLNLRNVSLNEVAATQDLHARQTQNFARSSSGDAATRQQQQPEQQNDHDDGSESGNSDCVHVTFNECANSLHSRWPENMRLLVALSRMLQMGVKSNDCGVPNPYEVCVGATIRVAGRNIRGSFKICGGYNTRLINTIVRGGQEEAEARSAVSAQQPQLPAELEAAVAGMIAQQTAAAAWVLAADAPQ